MGNMGVVGALSVAQNKSPETLDILESLKILNFVCQALKHVTQIWHKSGFKNLNSSQTPKNYFSQTIALSDVHCVLLKNSLLTWKFLEIFNLNDQFRPVKIALHLLICPLDEPFLDFWLFPSFWIGSKAQNKNPKTPEVFESLITLNFGCQALKYFT